MTTGSSPQGPRAHSRLAEIIVACAAFTKAPVPRARPRPDAFDVSDLVARLSCDLGRQMLVAVFVVGKLRATCQLRLKLITTGLTSSGSSLRSCLTIPFARSNSNQYEIVTGPLPPLQACDALVTTREIILNIAAKHGMRATLAPRVFSTSCWSHLFISRACTTPG